MSESRDWIRAQLAGQPESVAPSDEQARYIEGAQASGTEDEIDDQDEGQESADGIELPDEWPLSFWSRLTDSAKAAYERGEIDLAAEWELWSSGQVDAGEDDGYEEPPPAAPAELPPTADEAASYGQQWLELAREGGSDEASAADCFEQAQAWSDIARSAAIAEVEAGRRQSWDLSDEDERDVLQAEVNRRVAVGRERYGHRDD